MSGQKNNRFQFFKDKNQTQICRTDSEHFDIYRDKKHILAYNLSLKNVMQATYVTFSKT